MEKKIILFKRRHLLLVFFFVQTSLAGDFKGNGGSGVICGQSQVRILDFFESPHPILLSEAGESRQALIELYLTRIEKFAPLRAQLYRTWVNKFDQESLFLDSISLNPILDTDYIVPPDCHLVQVINQNPGLLTSGKHYIIDKFFWNQMDIKDQVGFMFHEFIYRESFLATSKSIRQFNALIASNKTQDLKIEDLVELQKRAGLPWADYFGFQIDLLRDISVSSTGRFLAFYPLDHSILRRPDLNLEVRSDLVELHDNMEIKKIRFYGNYRKKVRDDDYFFITEYYTQDYLEFYDNGSVNRGTLSWDYQNKIENSQAELKYLSIQFYPSGSISQVGMSNGKVKVMNSWVNIDVNSEVYFYENGWVSQLTWGYKDTLIQWGQNIYPAYKSVVKINRQGEVSSFISRIKGQIIKPNHQVIKFNEGEEVNIN